jgi:hypothetical protein
MDKIIECSREFQKELLNICERCYKEESDNCTITFEYSRAVIEVDFTFRVRSKDND